MNLLTPTKLDQFIINKDIASKFINFTKTNIINTLIYGKPNSGKKTLIKSKK